MNKIKSFFKILFCDHDFENQGEYWMCIICNMVPYCRKHKEPKYVHGYDQFLDCRSCQNERMSGRDNEI